MERDKTRSVIRAPLVSTDPTTAISIESKLRSGKLRSAGAHATVSSGNHRNHLLAWHLHGRRANQVGAKHASWGTTTTRKEEKEYMHTRIATQAWKPGLLFISLALIGASCDGTYQADTDQNGAAESSALALTAGTTTAYEAEALARTASSVGSKVTADTAASGGKYVEFNGTAATGAWIEFTLPNLAAGAYDLKFLYKSNTNRGIVQVTVDGVNQGATCNEYATTAALQVACSLGSKTLSAGNHQIRFTVTGKATSSAGYQMVVDQISLTAKASDRPCDIYAAANTPCAAAYSMVRGLSTKYTGPLYQVRNGSSSTNMGTGGTTKDIGMTPDGYADTTTQDSFCVGTVCTVSKLYDQSGNGNDLQRGTAGPAGNGSRSGFNDYESSATKLSVTAGGHKVYALYTNQYEGYRTPVGIVGKGLPIGNKDQGVYELADGTHFGTACCWDFGVVSPDPNKYVTMNTIFFGTGYWGTGAGSGPWFMGDFEGGVWSGGSGASNVNNPSNPSMKVPFALGILHTPVGKYALRMANVQSASDLTTAYDGAIPSGKTWGNAGGIALGIASDNSNNSFGTFYEGAITNGSPSNATDLLIMKNIQAVGYTK